MSSTIAATIPSIYDHFDEEADVPNTTMDSTSYTQSADGTLVIMVVRAKHLPNRRKLDKQSPYVVVRLGTNAKKTKSDFRAGQTPEWTHEIRFDITREKKPLLKIDLLDETKGDPTPIGSCEIDASQVFSDLGNKRDRKYILDKWYDLTFQGKRAGMLYLEMTFYPSAPVLPPKVPSHEEEHHVVDNGRPYGSSISPIQSPPTQAHHYESSPVHDVFVSSDNSKHSKRSSIFSKTSQYFLNTGEGSASSHESSDEVIISHPKVGSKSPNKYMSKLNKLKDKIQSKQSLWGSSDNGNMANTFFSSPSRRDISPISAYGSNVDGLGQDPSGSHISQNQKLDDFDLDLEFKSPPPPPPHQSHSKPLPPAPGRKPPSSVSRVNLKDSTSIPFSADSIGLDDNADSLPTKVYLLDEPVKSLTCNAKHTSSQEVSAKDDIDPKYYAPTPSEHFNRQMRFSNNSVTKDDLRVDLRTNRTGYVGDGKFSPSVFQKASINKPFNVYDDSDDEEEAKPEVPPKIPQGLNEMEYYILEKEKYLRDLQARRA
ncbi:Inn1 protein [Candida orthopsilosis Co 90-125]|uniref:Inn1 protein n=1 Tax=Candida orthopsilosis (strain 90-125) TaxID=1136231 RepID=H8WVP4_CANO9|nr:Inn1 protein [Candida orthopsilosis Co 90-125]CCG20517.1 Inn1 protein [Candida orthopsilosis Co 90-125]